MLHKFEYGTGHLQLDLNEDKVRAILAPKAVAAVEDVAEATAESLRRPLWSAPLREMLDGAATALIITVDNTRPSPTQMLLPILDACEEQNVCPTIIIAMGGHRQMTPEEVQQHLSPEVCQRAKVVQHDPLDRNICKHLGTTERGTEILINEIVFEHDLILGVGIVEPSYLLGWSGGRKLMMPGLSYSESIDNNHYYLTHPEAKIGKLHGNPLSDDSMEFMKDIPYHFITYTISGPNDETVEVISGDPVKAHEEACKRATDIYKIERVTAPVVISSPGGAPYDFNLVQGKKAILPAGDLVEPGGAVILLAECPDGHGAEPTFLEWLCSKTPKQVTKEVQKRELFSLGAHGANILAKPIVEKDASVMLVTNPQLGRQLKDSYLETPQSLEEAWEMAQRKCGPGPEVVICRKARRLIYV